MFDYFIFPLFSLDNLLFFIIARQKDFHIHFEHGSVRVNFHAVSTFLQSIFYFQRSPFRRGQSYVYFTIHLHARKMSISFLHSFVSSSIFILIILCIIFCQTGETSLFAAGNSVAIGVRCRNKLYVNSQHVHCIPV